jgi:hypothetical protein
MGTHLSGGSPVAQLGGLVKWVETYPIEAGALLSFCLFVVMVGYLWTQVGRSERLMLVLTTLILLLSVISIVRRHAVPEFTLPLWASVTYTLVHLAIVGGLLYLLYRSDWGRPATE